MNSISRIPGIQKWPLASSATAPMGATASPDGYAGSAPSTVPVAPAPDVDAAKKPLRDPRGAVAFCDSFNAGVNLSPADLAEKHALMCASPLKLARCMPALFMSDILTSHADLLKLSDAPAPVVWIQGDCHLGNFGIVQSRHGHAAWGLNDYDMTCKGSPAMDLGRLAFSLVSAMRERGIEAADTSKTVRKLAKAYFDEVASISKGEDEGEAYLNARQTSGAIHDLVLRAGAVTRDEWIKEYATRGADGQWRFAYSDEVRAVDPGTRMAVSDALHVYDQGQGPTPSVARPLQILGVAQKTQSGGSSHGQPRYLALVESGDPSQPPVILEVKQEQPAPLVGWDGDNAAALKSSRPNWSGDLRKADATQVVRGQLAMGGDQNPLTGSTTIDGISYLVREREPCKATLNEKHLSDPDEFKSFADQAGTVVALAHGRSKPQASAILQWMGERDVFATRLDAFAQAYSDQAEADVKAFRAAHPQGVEKKAEPNPDSAG